jgi:hypothetical protein
LLFRSQRRQIAITSATRFRRGYALALFACDNRSREAIQAAPGFIYLLSLTSSLSGCSAPVIKSLELGLRDDLWNKSICGSCKQVCALAEGPHTWMLEKRMLAPCHVIQGKLFFFFQCRFYLTDSERFSMEAEKLRRARCKVRIYRWNLRLRTWSHDIPGYVVVCPVG